MTSGSVLRITPLLAAALVSVAVAQEPNLGPAQPPAPGSETAPAVTPPAGTPADERLDRAARAVAQGKVDDALGLIREAAKGHPDWPTPRLILARILLKDNLNAAARRTLEQAAADAPDDPSVYLTFANLALGEGRLSDARLNAEAALAASGAKHLEGEPARTVLGEANLALAAVAEARGDWSGARARLAAALEARPKDGASRERLARALFQLGKAEECFEELKRAVAADAKLDPPGVTMARLWARKGDAKMAAEWFDYARKADPQGVTARLAEARWRLDQGKLAEARALADEAAKLSPGSKDVDRLRALLAWQARDFAAAERALEPLHRDAPADIATADLLARSLAEQDDPEKKARALQLAVANARQAPRSAEVLATLGRAQYRVGRLDEAERALRAAVSGGQASPDTAYFLARVLADRGRKDEAKALARKAAAQPGPFAYRDEAERWLAAP